jgi:hypothetical protein
MRDAKAGEVFELVPPEGLREGLKEGTLRAAKPGRGDASVLIKRVDDGTIAGKSDLKRLKPSALEILGPAAWQALALATQQHYLADISAKLEGIQQGVDELKKLHYDQVIGTLDHLSALADRVDGAARRDGTVAPHQLAEMRRKTTDAEQVWHQALKTARRHVEEYGRGEVASDEVKNSFVILMYATKVFVRCSSALAALPYETATALDQALADEEARMYPTLPAFLDLCEELLRISGSWETKAIEYESRLPKNRIARRLHLPPVDIRGGEGVTVRIGGKPKRKALDPSDTRQLEELVVAGRPKVSTLVARVDDDGSIVLGPPRQAPPSTDEQPGD